jgi:hypothetical protein
MAPAMHKRTGYKSRKRHLLRPQVPGERRQTQRFSEAVPKVRPVRHVSLQIHRMSISFCKRIDQSRIWLVISRPETRSVIGCLSRGRKRSLTHFHRLPPLSRILYFNCMRRACPHGDFAMSCRHGGPHSCHPGIPRQLPLSGHIPYPCKSHH